MYKIIIAENIPSLNKGEMTVIEGCINSFSELGDTFEISMVSILPEIDTPRYNKQIRIIDAKRSFRLPGNPRKYKKIQKILVSIYFTIQHFFFLALYLLLKKRTVKIFNTEIWHAYLESDVIFVGHNGSFGIGGGLGIYKNISYLFLPFMGRILKKPLVVYGASIDPYRKRRFVWRIFRFIFQHMDLITLRENGSLHNIEQMGLKTNKIALTGDPAFLLRPEKLERVKEIMSLENIDKNTRPLFGLTVTRRRALLSFPEIDKIDEKYQKHNEMIAEIIDRIIEKYEGMIIFLPHCIGFSTDLDDRLVAEDIFKICKHKDMVKIINNEYTAAELKGIIGQFDFFLGERIHSVINALSIGTPAIALSNGSDQRLDIIRMLGQDDSICLLENLDIEKMITKISDMWLKRENIKVELKSQTNYMTEQALLNGKLLKQLLSSR